MSSLLFPQARCAACSAEWDPHQDEDLAIVFLDVLALRQSALRHVVFNRGLRNNDSLKSWPRLAARLCLATVLADAFLLAHGCNSRTMSSDLHDAAASSLFLDALCGAPARPSALVQRLAPSIAGFLLQIGLVAFFVVPHLRLFAFVMAVSLCNVGPAAIAVVTVVLGLAHPSLALAPTLATALCLGRIAALTAYSYPSSTLQRHWSVLTAGAAVVGATAARLALVALLVRGSSGGGSSVTRIS
eukprot:m.142435 g.142435  ORF g.142435 m.142435 type:complete len:244 (+) comp10036_c0_seq4:2744-3475(+)